MSFIPGLNVITDKVPELHTPQGILRAAASVIGVFGVSLLAVVWLDGRWPFAAVLLQLLMYGALHWLLRSFFNGPAERLDYSEAFFNRFLIAAGLNLATLTYILLTKGGVTEGAAKLVPSWVGWIIGLYLLASAVLLLVRGIRAAGADTLAGVYVYYPDEGERIEDSVYEVVRHPVYSAIDRTAIAFGLINGTPMSLLLAVFFVAVWHPVWYAVEERELVRRFGQTYRDYIDSVPATWPSSLMGEVGLWQALRSVTTPAASEPQQLEE